MAGFRKGVGVVQGWQVEWLEGEEEVKGRGRERNRSTLAYFVKTEDGAAVLTVFFFGPGVCRLFSREVHPF